MIVGNPVVISAIGDTVGSNGVLQMPANGKGVVVGIGILAASGTSPTLTVTLAIQDPVTGAFLNVLSSTALAATAGKTDILVVYPGITVAANQSASSLVAPNLLITTVVGGTSPSVTYNITAYPIA